MYARNVSSQQDKYVMCAVRHLYVDCVSQGKSVDVVFVVNVTNVFFWLTITSRHCRLQQRMSTIEMKLGTFPPVICRR